MSVNVKQMLEYDCSANFPRHVLRNHAVAILVTAGAFVGSSFTAEIRAGWRSD